MSSNFEEEANVYLESERCKRAAEWWHAASYPVLLGTSNGGQRNSILSRAVRAQLKRGSYLNTCVAQTLI